MHRQENEKVWHAYARNCGSDETCCKNWFAFTREPVGHSEALRIIKENFDVWYEYAIVHVDYVGRYAASS
jgi:hypothetical protein